MPRRPATHDAAPSAADVDGARRGLSVAELRRLFRLAAPQAWAAPLLVTLGFAASLAETLGITLVVVFLYVAMGRGAEAPATGGLLDPVFAAVRTHLGDGGSVAIAGMVFVLIAAKAALGLAYTLVLGEGAQPAERGGAQRPAPPLSRSLPTPRSGGTTRATC